MYSGSPNNQENTVFVIYLQLYVLSLGRWKNHPGHLSVHVSAGAKLCSWSCIVSISVCVIESHESPGTCHLCISLPVSTFNPCVTHTCTRCTCGHQN